MQTRAGRRQLRALLVNVAPWITATDWGPATVDAGNCVRCDALPRLIDSCGPDGGPRCRTCLLDDGLDAWCDGHAVTAAAALDWAQSLPDNWTSVATLWWVATGEVQLGAVTVRAALTSAGLSRH